jgi:glycerol uptake facilitator-like aquaporin
MQNFDLPRRLVAEALGTALLVATVVGSGIMAETLTKDVALALLGNTLPTGAILVVLIAILGPVSGAHFNPAVSVVFALRRELTPRDALLYIAVQIVAAFGLVATILAGLRFDRSAIPWLVGLYITAAYWFTSSTSFANPAVAIARSMTNTFSGIRPADLPGFIVAEFCGAVIALMLMRWLLRATGEGAPMMKEAQS